MSKDHYRTARIALTVVTEVAFLVWLLARFIGWVAT